MKMIFKNIKIYILRVNMKKVKLKENKKIQILNYN